VSISREPAEIQALHELWNATAPKPPTAEEVLDGLLQALCDLPAPFREQLRREADRLANEYVESTFYLGIEINDPYLVGLNRLIEALEARTESEEEIEREMRERPWTDLD